MQRNAALEIGNMTRLANAKQYRTIKRLTPDGATVVVTAILRDPQGRENSMQVGALLKSIPGIGPIKQLDLLTRAHVHGRVHLGNIKEMQRDHLAKLLEQRRSN